MAIKKARFMQQFVGKEFEGLISSVTRFGVFVLLREYDIDGLVRAEEIGNGRWEFDENTLKLVSRGSGDSLSVGDTLKVIVAAADPVGGQITFVPADQKERPVARKGDFRSNKNEPRSQDSRKSSSKKEEKKRGRRSSNKPSGKDSQKRGETEDNRGGVRKARVSRSGEKSSPGPVSGGKAQRKRRR